MRSTRAMSEDDSEKKEDEEIIICGRYRIAHKIGSGTFGTVMLGIDSTDGSTVAMKFEAKSKRLDRLWREFNIYKHLRKETGFPKVFLYCNQGDFRIMVMELLGPSLEDLFNFCNRRFSLKTVLLLQDQLLSRLQILHGMGIVHRDIKPDNFVMGLGSSRNIVHLIDMGLSKNIWQKSESKFHIPLAIGRPFCGTPRFASLNAHNGIELSRRDDLISLAYNLIYFLKGELPWFHCKDFPKTKYSESTAFLKSKITTKELCHDCPEEFAKFLDYCYELKFDEVPDYSSIRRMFLSLFLKMKYVYDNMFDWNLYKCERNLQKENKSVEEIAEK